MSNKWCSGCATYGTWPYVIRVAPPQKPRLNEASVEQLVEELKSRADRHMKNAESLRRQAVQEEEAAIAARAALAK